MANENNNDVRSTGETAMDNLFENKRNNKLKYYNSITW